MLVTCPNNGLVTLVLMPPRVVRLKAFLNSARNWNRYFSVTPELLLQTYILIEVSEPSHLSVRSRARPECKGSRIREQCFV